jgi:Glycosyl transferase family 64 domain
VKLLVALTNGLLTLWEQARGRRRRFGSSGPARGDGPAPDGPVATVVLLNWQRPSNVRTILDAYTRYRRIAEIIVWNNNPDLTFTYEQAKVRSVNSAELGLSTRWAAALLASHACVIVADDDLIADEETIDRLIDWFRQDPDRVYTLHGRNPTPDNEYAVHVDHVRQPTEAVMHLTRLTCLHRRHVPHYFLAVEELGLRVDPASGGGEDIVMSFALTRATGKRPLVVPGSYRDLLAPQGIANRYGSQRQQRTAIMRRCQAWLDDSAHVHGNARPNP